MAGTIFSLALSQRFDTQGRLLVNAPLYLYQANTLIPVDSYADSGLSVLNPWPLRTDSAGMIPEFWLPDGSYRARLTDARGSTVLFDLLNVMALGPSEGGGGGGGGSVDQTAILKTGDFFWQPVSATRTGAVRANGRTIGSATSGATERANADTQPLFEFIWNTFPNSLCPVTGGRGSNAASDFLANKQIATLDMRGRGPLGLDDMGNIAAGTISGGSPTVPGSGGGAESRSFNVTKANLPDYALPHTLTITNNTGVVRNFSWTIFNLAAGGVDTPRQFNLTQDTLSLGGSIRLDGGGQAISVNTMSPYRLGTWFIKL
ncbi:hypothetical protein W911_14315 [Hyphomicrobium nitrativorans NL23]|uniref:Tail fiber protein n=1 Tax=Hyphomicrobium nitrativorans NL23 TaxID=1029756 RepID=V5SJS1_9HYPH|nr:hypothetical protein [Hyphomicrobium nitrativorans]AHB50320.1 hypothetical protein W911_14315 [Hyphomicrobium nitrativorans NL23]